MSIVEIKAEKSVQVNKQHPAMPVCLHMLITDPEIAKAALFAKHDFGDKSNS